MLYYLFGYLKEEFNMPGAGVFQYISFRAALAIITSLVISLIFGKQIIQYLLRKQVGETVRDLGLQGQSEKQGTPTMGGLIIIGAILIPTLLFARLFNVYVIIMIITTVWLGVIGFIDDYIKVFKKDKAGLAGKFKILGQVGLGIIIGFTLYFNPNVVVKERVENKAITITSDKSNVIEDMRDKEGALYSPKAIKSTKTTIPFIKNHEFDYAYLISWMGPGLRKYAWLVFIPIVILIITAVSNGANITDGIDGLATGTSAIIGATLGILAYVSGNTVFAKYLDIMYIPNAGELLIDPKAAYLHITTNNTIFGTQWHALPDAKGVPLVADMCSDILSRPIDAAKFALIYAGAQKNLGPAGLALAAVDRDWLKDARKDVPDILSYAAHLDARSIYHTPPPFALIHLS